MIFKSILIIFYDFISISGERPYECPVCQKRFSTTISLKTHSYTHTGERPHRCPHCPKTFSTSSKLSRHVVTHSEKRPYPCDQCNKTFNRSGKSRLTLCLRLIIYFVNTWSKLLKFLIFITMFFNLTFKYNVMNNSDLIMISFQVTYANITYSIQGRLKNFYNVINVINLLQLNKGWFNIKLCTTLNKKELR